MARRKAKLDAITTDQLYHLIFNWCLDGCEPWYSKPGYPFADDDDRREAWEQNRDEIMDLIGGKEGDFADPRFLWGSRPQAWWQYESPELRNFAQDELDQLEDMGVLKVGERGRREQFERKKREFYDKLRQQSLQND